MLKNIKLQAKAMLRDTFSKILFILGLVLFTASLIYFIVFCFIDSGVFFAIPTNNILHTLYFLDVFFIFISFEECFKLKKYNETVFETKKSTRNMYINQLCILVIYACIFFVEGLIFNIVSLVIIGQVSFETVLYTFKIFVFYFLLSILSSISLGFILSQLRNRIAPYIFMVLIAVTETGLMDTISAGFGNKTGINITKLLELFNLTIPGTEFLPDLITGTAVTPDTVCHLLFFIVLGFAVFYLIDPKKRKNRATIIKSTVSLCLCLIMIFVYFVKYSSPKLDLGAGGLAADKRYYLNAEQNEQAADFKVKKYELTFSFTNKLKCTAKITVDNSKKDEYDFTLYHGYKVKKVLDENGIELPFSRDVDTLTIKNISDNDMFVVEYSGSSDTFYSNFENVMLPGHFAYYPVAGQKRCFGEYGFYNIAPDYEIDFDVNIQHYSDVFCNLSDKPDTHFSGKTNALTIMNGFIASYKMDNMTVYFPKYNKMITTDYIKDAIGDYSKNNPQIKHLYDISAMQLDTDYACIFDDYIVLDDLSDFERLVLLSEIAPYKYDLFDYVRMYDNVRQGNMTQDEYDHIKTPISEKVKAILSNDDGTAEKKIMDYLTDENDTRSIMDFLNDLL